MLYSHHEIVRSHDQGPVSPSYALRTSHQWTSVLGRIARGAHTSSRSRTRDSRRKYQRMNHWTTLERFPGLPDNHVRFCSWVKWVASFCVNFWATFVGPLHRRLDMRKNTYDSFPLVVLGFMFDIGEEESHFLKQFYLGPVLREWLGHRTPWQRLWKQSGPRWANDPQQHLQEAWTQQMSFQVRVDVNKVRVGLSHRDVA